MKSIYDDTYQELKNNGASGWGGETFEKRMQGWDENIQQLRINDLLPPSPAELLELGSGTGDVCFKFAKLGYHVSGAEISPTAVKWAQEKAVQLGVKAEFHADDVCELPSFKDQFYDFIYDGNCSHCIIGDDRNKFFSAVAAKLKPGGKLYISCMVNDPNHQANYGGKFDPVERLHYKDDIAVRYSPLKNDLLLEIENAGFKLQHEWLNENPWWQHFHGVFTKIC